MDVDISMIIKVLLFCFPPNQDILYQPQIKLISPQVKNKEKLKKNMGQSFEKSTCGTCAIFFVLHL